ncbi:hypothetical protein GLOIN_2v1789095 [Rhizophagus clarus]|uniref:Uncharacterized protein n=1 Tax=Rhizophagus clarus TaxID=94130 RepID=A0A8H3LDA4_9GLOM|nr:hypothetical protein GLOIN_2v1789095 [Rhizophagus clarus]
MKSKDAKKDQENAITARKQSPNQSKKWKRDNLDSFHPNKPSDNEDSIPPDSFFPDSFQLSNEKESINIPFSSNFRIPALTLDKNDNDVNYFNEENDYNIDQDYIYQEEEDDDDDDDKDQEEKNEDEDNIKNIFASPKFDSDEVFMMENLNDSLETEIILWAFKFQQRFQLTDMALEALINTFFTPETATTNLGLLFNLDWFQPFTYTQHSTGAIYASICNLPRSERNKPKNIIYLGFLPGSKEVGLDRINHYLVPIIDELIELWKGWKVPKTYQYPDGLDIKVALIIGSSDILTTRKLFGHGENIPMK